MSPSSPQLFTDPEYQVDIARDIQRLAMEQWADRHQTVLIGKDATIFAALEKVARFAQSESAVLITGETGTGKELFARALYLLSRRRGRPFMTINCAQYHDGQLLASELFGHRRGSFTGAVADHRGVFEEGDGGVVFLDEIGELSPTAQAMLLRVLGEGEIMPVGSTRPVNVEVRVVAATSRDLRPMVDAGTFRSDLYYRLRYLHVEVPPVRQRGNDWELIASYYLRRLSARHAARKTFSPTATSLMRDYHWPGNVRELRSVVDTGYHLSSGNVIDAHDFGEQLEVFSRQSQMARVPLLHNTSDCLSRMTVHGESFWAVVHGPLMNRELSRSEAREIVAQGLDRSRGSYKRLLGLFGVADADYLKFMDFLRHQKLKPE
jgi:transcriptional regulator with GAF, ATPase, and Fis domain